MNQTFLKEKRDCLVLGLNEADMRFNIAISKMQQIKNRVDDLEVFIYSRQNCLFHELKSRIPRIF